MAKASRRKSNVGAKQAASRRRSSSTNEEDQLEDLIARAQAEARAELEAAAGESDAEGTPRRSRRSLSRKKSSLREADTDDDEEDGEDEEDTKQKSRKRGRASQNGKSHGGALSNSIDHAIAAGKEELKENVFLFVPNLIGYSRIILAALSLYFMEGNPKNCTVLYCISCLLDAFDGMAARALGQSTKFGAVLDMVTDRCTTACLLCFLTAAYPRCAIIFQGLITLDFSSHYIHMYGSLLAGSKSHKTVSKEVSKWLWYYYNNSNILFVFCAGNEIFFVCLYLMAFYTRPLGINPYYVFLPLGSSNAQAIITYAAVHPFSVQASFVRLLEGLTWPQLLGAVTFPICAIKQIINAIQFWKAAKALVEVDTLERSKARAAASPKKRR